MNKNTQIILTTTIATIVTYYLSINLGLGAVVASGIVGLSVALFLPTDLSIVAYTAAFAGMSSAQVLASYPMVAFAGLLVGIIFIITQPLYQGFGGKLGTIAACAVFITARLFRLF
ncbi:hypothetical protein SAMN02745227_01703 [Anaerobranca californiensis DSM 14826]|jgi:hypothetical protein|uniref:Uncharacterized protein n=1 Tax=Anaerobranca californiensis DSM 14826 TaxID=1120989 RepID=A0A1M6QB13_9FIRM|nr:hypothetical protein [Anaerobranca californiensis]SHK17320.1 hypothetical protein SAMN02745227_01703 [Anaerobranca californiensis DSM 14826]